MDPEHIALAFDGGFLELIHVNHRTPKLILELPRISNMEGLDVSIRSDERPPIWEPNDDIFYVSRHESLLLIDVLVRNFQGDGSDGEYRIIVPTWKLRTLLNTSIASERKEWSEWGPQNTMGFHIQQFESSSWSSVFGSRYLTVESERLVMYDFNRYALRPPVGDTSDELAETDLLTSKVSEVYAGPLPHRKYYTSQMIPAGSNVAMAEGFVVEYHVCFISLVQT